MNFFLVEARVDLSIDGDVVPLTLINVVGKDLGVLHIIGNIQQGLLIHQAGVLAGAHINQVIHLAAAEFLHHYLIVIGSRLFDLNIQAGGLFHGLLEKLHLLIVFSSGNAYQHLDGSAGRFRIRLFSILGGCILRFYGISCTLLRGSIGSGTLSVTAAAGSHGSHHHNRCQKHGTDSFEFHTRFPPLFLRFVSL